MSGIGGWSGDARLALRSIRHSPLFSAVVVATMALAIGGVTAVFTLVDPMLFRPLPYGAADRIVKARADGGPLSFLQYADYFGAKNAGVFERVGTLYGPAEIGRLREDDDTIIGYAVTDGFLDVLQVAPAAGRLFTVDEYQRAVPAGPGSSPGPQIAVITDGLWKRAFGGRPDVAGQKLSLLVAGGTHSIEVVGVLRPDFVFPDQTNDAPAFLVPGALDPARAGDARAYTDLFGRLRPGQTIEQATTALQQVVTAAEREFPKLPQHRQAGIRSLRESLFGPVQTPMLMLLALTLCVLVLASVNLAHLYLARAAGRVREIAVRQALGASPWLVVRLLLTEALILAVTGGAAAIAAGNGLYAAVMSVMPRYAHVYRLMQARVDFRVVTMAVLMTAGVLIVFGLIPALRVVRSDVRSALQATANRTRRGRRRGDAVLTAVQSSLAVSVLVTAALLIGSFVKKSEAINGIDLTGLSSVAVQLPRDFATDPPSAHGLYRELAARVAPLLGQTPGITRGLPGMTLPGPLGETPTPPIPNPSSSRTRRIARSSTRSNSNWCAAASTPTTKRGPTRRSRWWISELPICSGLGRSR